MDLSVKLHSRNSYGVYKSCRKYGMGKRIKENIPIVWEVSFSPAGQTHKQPFNWGLVLFGGSSTNCKGVRSHIKTRAKIVQGSLGLFEIKMKLCMTG